MTRLYRSLALASLLLANVAQGVTLPEALRVELENGTVLILLEKPEVPLIGFEAVIRGGAVTDPEGKGGLSSLFAGLIEKGAGERDAATFAETVGSVGGRLSTSAGLETISISGEFLARDADLAVELLVDMLRAPNLEQQELKKLRDRRVNLIRADKDGDPRPLTPLYGNAFLFGDHPYGNAVYGSEESLANIEHSDVLQYYEDYVGADRLTIAMVGDFDVVLIREKLSGALADWRAAAAPLPVVEPFEPQLGRRVLLVDKPGATQTYFWIGNIGVAVDYPQRAELDLANTLFGGRFTSLLVDELRTKAGLTYSARSVLRRPTAAGSVAIVSYTQTETTTQTMDLAIELLARLLGLGFDAELVQSAKNYILGQYPPRLETATQLAGQFAELEALGLDTSFVNDYGAAIANADGETIQTVITSVYPHPDNLVFAIIGDADQIREEVAKYGPITEMMITDPSFRSE